MKNLKKDIFANLKEARMDIYMMQ